MDPKTPSDQMAAAQMAGGSLNPDGPDADIGDQPEMSEFDRIMAEQDRERAIANPGKTAYLGRVGKKYKKMI